MSNSVEIKKLDYFYPSGEDSFNLMPVLFAHLSYSNRYKILDSNKVQPISITNIVSKHKRTIKHLFTNKIELINIPDCCFVCNMLKIDNVLYFTSFNGGRHISSANLISYLDTSFCYSFCLANIIKKNAIYKDDDDILKYNNYILSTFWQTKFQDILHDHRARNDISKFYFRVNSNNKPILTDNPYSNL